MNQITTWYLALRYIPFSSRISENNNADWYTSCFTNVFYTNTLIVLTAMSIKTNTVTNLGLRLSRTYFHLCMWGRQNKQQHTRQFIYYATSKIVSRTFYNTTSCHWQSCGYFCDRFHCNIYRSQITVNIWRRLIWSGVDEDSRLSGSWKPISVRTIITNEMHYSLSIYHNN
jgi:hypothetical protein